MLSIESLFSQQIILKGQITIQNSQYRSGKIEYVKGAIVSCPLAGSTICETDDQGFFALTFVGIKSTTSVNLYVEKNGLEVVNSWALNEVTIGREKILSIWMAQRGEIPRLQADLYVTNKQKLFQQKDATIKRLNAGVEESKKALKELNIKFGTDFQSVSEAIKYITEKTEELASQIPSLLKDLTTVNLDFCSAIYRKAYEYFQKGNTKMTIETLKDSELDILYESSLSDKNSADSLNNSSKYKMDEWLNSSKLKASSFFLESDFKEAAKAYKKILKILVENNYSKKEINKIYLALGNSLKETKQYEDALFAYSNSINFDSTNFEAYDGRAYCYWKLHNNALAVQDYLKMFIIDPSIPFSYQRASLEGNAYINGTKFWGYSRAYMKGENYTDTDFNNSNLALTRFSNCDFRKVKNIDKSILTCSVYDDNTRWPDDFDPNLAGAINESKYLQIIEQRIDSIGSIECLQSFSNYFYDKGDYFNALIYTNKIIESLRSKKNRDSSELSLDRDRETTLLQQRGLLLYVTDRWDSAIYSFDSALVGYNNSSLIEDVSARRVTCGFYKSKCYERMGDFKNASLSYETAIEYYLCVDIDERLGQIDFAASYLKSWVDTLNELGEYSKIEKLLKPLLKDYIASEENIEQLDLFIYRIGVIQYFKEEYDSSIYYLQRGLFNFNRNTDYKYAKFYSYRSSMIISSCYEKMEDFDNASINYENTNEYYLGLERDDRLYNFEFAARYLDSWVDTLCETKEYAKIEKLLKPLIKDYLNSNYSIDIIDLYVQLIGEIEFEKELYDSSIYYLKHALINYSENKEFKSAMVRIFQSSMLISNSYEELGDFENAESCYITTMSNYILLDSIQQIWSIEFASRYLETWIEKLHKEGEFGEIYKLLSPIVDNYILTTQKSKLMDSYVALLGKIQYLLANYYFEKKSYKECIFYANEAIGYYSHLDEYPNLADLILDDLNIYIESCIIINQYDNAVNACNYGIEISTKFSKLERGCEIVNKTTQALKSSLSKSNISIIIDYKSVNCK
ncbi:MAG: hypothetical protein ACKVQV_10190 [Bacteroidia bacterium]